MFYVSKVIKNIGMGYGKHFLKIYVYVTIDGVFIALVVIIII